MLAAAQRPVGSVWLEAVAAVPEFFRHADLLEVQAKAALELGQRRRRGRDLPVVLRHPEQAESGWSRSTMTKSNRIEQFWDLGPALEIPLFPAWLLARAYPLPTIPNPPNTSEAQALERVRKMRKKPNDVDQRGWFQKNHPMLLQQLINPKAI